ncbi:response regulator [Microaerobacter geothermalis]|uniref:response regulator n=1 Tax=Microaerobacter geothermalis TaxID=674972 RepID=UPI001F40F366|nr:response regulator [Microaerobacter geothermalis]MCF6092457.1 response regulator [Microaerobacter geothermalis]
MTRIAVIEDILLVRYYVKEILESVGYEVDDYPSADIFFLQTSPEYYDCIICDIFMPGLLGWDTIKRIKSSSHSHTPIIVMSAKSDRETILKAISLGASDFIVKPIQKQPFLHRVKKILDLSHKLKKKIPRRVTLSLDQLLEMEKFRCDRSSEPFSLINMDITTIEDKLTNEEIFLSKQEYFEKIYELIQPKLRRIDLILQFEDELFILLPMTDHQGAQVVIEKLWHTVYVFTQEHPYYLMEIGAASYPTDSKEIDDLVRFSKLSRKTKRE